MKIKQYMIPVYAVLVKNGKRNIEELPEVYIVPVCLLYTSPSPRDRG